jgi:hypothetical protein
MNNKEYILTIVKKIDKSVMFEAKIDEEQKSNIVVYLLEEDDTYILPTDKPKKQKPKE